MQYKQEGTTRDYSVKWIEHLYDFYKRKAQLRAARSFGCSFCCAHSRDTRMQPATVFTLLTKAISYLHTPDSVE